MKTWTRWIMVLFVIMNVVYAQTLPTDGLVGQWKFDNAASLTKAAIGNDLVPDKLAAATLQISAVPGPTAGNGAVNVGLGSFFRCYHGIEANGFDPTLPDSAAIRVNRFAFVIDFHIPTAGLWYSFHATDNNGDPAQSDWDSFIRANGGFGVGSTGYSYYQIKDTQGWYRLVINADLGNFYRYYLDGQLLRDCGTRRLNDRFSLDSPDGSNQVLFFGDNDGEDAPIDIAQLSIYNRPLTVAEIEQIGGYGHLIELDTPVSAWSFDKKDSLYYAKPGRDLELVGAVKAVAGPSSRDGAARVGAGAYLKANTDILPNGFVIKNNVNRYTMVMDVKQPQRGKFSALLQTNPANNDDADLFINPEGKIGSSAIGWSDSALYVGEWSRVGFVYSAGDTLPNLQVFIDGKIALKVAKLEADGDLSLLAKTGLNKFLLFTDDNGEDASVDVANVAVYNRALTEKEVVALGKYDHLRSVENTPAGKTAYFRVADESQYGKIAYHPDFDWGESTSFTIECWVRPDIGYAGDPSILSNKDWGSGGNTGWILSGRGSDWKFNIADTKNRRWDFTITTPTIHDGFWHHIAVSVNRETQECVLLTDSSSTVPQSLKDGAGLPLGNINNPMPICFMQDGTENYSDGYKMPGAIDEIRIWTAALTKETLKKWAHRSVTNEHPNFANLITYLKMDEGTGSSVADASGKGHNAELKGAYQWQVSYAPLADAVSVAGNNLTGIWGGQKTATSAELTVAADFKFTSLLMAQMSLTKGIPDENKTESFLEEMYALTSHNGLAGAVKTDLSGGAVARMARVWYVDASATFNQKSTLIFTLGSTAGAAANYVLLNRVADSGTLAPLPATAVVFDNTVTFTGVAIKDGNYYTLGTKDETASPLGTSTGVQNNAGMVYTYNLSQAYPNPFNPSTFINYSLAKNSDVKLTVYNSLGQVVATLIDMKKQAAGQYQIQWSAQNLPSGLYLYRLEAEEFNSTQKVMLLK